MRRNLKTTYVSAYMIGTVYAGVEQKDKAFDSLEKAYQERSSDLPWFLKADLRIDSLRSDPRYADLIPRVGLPGLDFRGNKRSGMRLVPIRNTTPLLHDFHRDDNLIGDLVRIGFLDYPAQEMAISDRHRDCLLVTVLGISQRRVRRFDELNEARSDQHHDMEV